MVLPVLLVSIYAVARRLFWSLGLLLCVACADTLPASGGLGSESVTYATVGDLAPIAKPAGELLQVAATTSIVGDVVAQVGGGNIALYRLLEPGVDPHSFAATPQVLRTLSEVDLIFVNGLHLEAGLDATLASAGVPIVSVNALVTPLVGEDDLEEGTETDHNPSDEHGATDPHTWQSVPNVQQWVTTIEQALSALDPANAAQYQANATTYQAILQALDQEIRTQVAMIPVERRKLVTDHETFTYFAHEYGFAVIGALVGSLSSTAESSAQEFAALQDQLVAEDVPTIFVGATVNPGLAEQLARDLDIVVVPLYTDALSGLDGPAATYVDFMRYNVKAIVTALQAE